MARKPATPGAMLMAAFLLATLTLVLIVGCSAKEGGEQAGGAEAATPEAAPAASMQPEAPAQPAAVSYRAQVAPIFAAKCNVCHHPENAVEVDLTRPFHPELGVINRPNTWTRSEKKLLVVPGDPDASALVWKVEQTELAPKIDGDPMPWNIPRLTEQELADLRRWIADGAENDELYRSTIARIFGDGVSLGSRGGKCSYCHYPGASFGPDLTDPFHPERGAVDLRSAYGEVRVVPGDPDGSFLIVKVATPQLPAGLGEPMPLHFERLTPSEQRILRDWIAQGARDN